jgi:hypothetical protein
MTTAPSIAAGLISTLVRDVVDCIAILTIVAGSLPIED